MLYREIIAVCSQIHTKHIHTQCGQNVELLNVKLAVHIVTTGLWVTPIVRVYRSSEQAGFRFLNIRLVCRSQMALEAVKESVTNEILSLGKCD